MQTAHDLRVASLVYTYIRFNFIHLHRQMIIAMVRIITKLPAYNSSISAAKCMITYSPPLIIAIYFKKSLVRIHPSRESNLTNIRVVPYTCGIYREIQVFNTNIKLISKHIAHNPLQSFCYKMTKLQSYYR